MPGLVKPYFVAPSAAEARVAMLFAIHRFPDGTATILAQHDALSDRDVTRVIGCALGHVAECLERECAKLTSVVERGLSSNGREHPYCEVLLTRNVCDAIEARHVRTLDVARAAARLGIGVTDLIGLQWQADRIYAKSGGYRSPFAQYQPVVAA